MGKEQAPQFIHRIDAADLIIHVNDAWCSFAQDNDGAALVPETILGTPLWRHMGGFSIVRLYQIICDRVRRRRQTAVFPFRCDAPDCRRHLEMRIEPLSGASLEFCSQVTRAESRPHEPLLAASRPDPGSTELLLMCSWCNRVSIPEWVEVEEAVRFKELFTSGVAIKLTHGICPVCLKDVMRRIGEA